MTSKPLESWINDWSDRERGAYLRGLRAGKGEAPDEVAEVIDELRAEVERLRAERDALMDAATTAKNLLSRKHPHSVADVDGDAWEAWAVLEAALVSDKE